MKPMALQNILSGAFWILVGVVLLAELAACARNPSAGVDGGPLVEADSWPPEVTINTCEPFAAVTVGSYVVESDYWNTWEVWQATPGTGSNSWTYLAYLIQAPMVTSVANLDLNAFLQDAVSRGYIQNSWYLYAIQAGIELRTGGLPYHSNSFSVSIN